MSNRLEYFVRKLWEIKGCPQIIQDAISAALAITTANKVSDERIKQRLEICGACPYILVVNEDELACGICNCTVSERHLLLNLAIYEEDTDTPKKWGCKFPGPQSKWQQFGV